MFEVSAYAKELNLINLEKHFISHFVSNTELKDALSASFDNKEAYEKRKPVIDFLLSKGADINCFHGRILDSIFIGNYVDHFNDYFHKFSFNYIIPSLSSLIIYQNEKFFDHVIHKIMTERPDEFINYDLKDRERFNFDPNHKKSLEQLIKLQEYLILQKDITETYPKSDKVSKNKI